MGSRCCGVEGSLKYLAYGVGCGRVRLGRNTDYVGQEERVWRADLSTRDLGMQDKGQRGLCDEERAIAKAGVGGGDEDGVRRKIRRQEKAKERAKNSTTSRKVVDVGKRR